MRVMHTIIALPSIAPSRFSKRVSSSEAISAPRFGCVAFRGSGIDVQLLGIEYRDFSGASLSGGKSLVQLASWSHTLKASEWTSRGYAVRLPLQAIQPEFRTNYAGFGAVVAKLVVPGAGVFEDTAELVRLRPFSPLRDLQEVQSNSRRLPGESTARGYGTAH